MAFRVRLPTIFHGAAYKKVFRWYSRDNEGVLTPIDLTGLAGRIQLRNCPGAPEVLADWSTENDRLIFDDTNRITIFVPLPETKTYTFESAEWDLIIWPVGNTSEGEVIMYGEVSGRPTNTEVP